MATKNPFERFTTPSTDKPKRKVNPRAGMMLSTSQEGVDVMSHNNAPNRYRERAPVPENFLREKVMEAKPAKKLIPPPVTKKKEDDAPPADRQAAALHETAAGLQVMGNNLADDNYVERVREAQDLPTPEKARAIPRDKLNGSNYIKAYRQQQAIDIEEAAQKAKAKAKIDKIIDDRKKDNQKFFEKKFKEDRKKADIYIIRARQLQSEIAGLKRNMGDDPETNRRLQAAIDPLQGELAGIPVVYW